MMSHISPQIERWIFRANVRLFLNFVGQWVPGLAICLAFALTGFVALGCSFFALWAVVMASVGVPRLIRQWVTPSEYVVLLDRQLELNGLITSALAIENGVAVGEARWMGQIQSQAVTALQGARPPKRAWEGSWVSLMALGFALTWGFTMGPEAPIERSLTAETRRILQEDLDRVEALIEHLEEVPEEQPEGVDAEWLDSLGELGRAVDSLLEPDLRGPEALQTLDEALEAVEEAKQKLGVVAMAEILAGLGEAAEYVGADPLENLEQDLRDAESDLETEQGENEQDSNPTGDEENPEPPEQTMPTEEPGDEGEEGEGDEEVMARVEKEGEGEEMEGDGTMPETLLDEPAEGDGSVMAGPGQEGTETVGKPSESEGGADAADTPIDPLAESAGTQWVAAQWNGDREGFTRTIRMMDDEAEDEGTRSAVTTRYRSIAEADLRVGNIPPGRAAYIQAYFDKLASQEAP